MLDQSILALSIATCFSSQRLSETLKKHLIVTSSAESLDQKRFFNSCRDSLRNDLDNDYPRRFRWNDINAAFDVVWPKSTFSGDQGHQMPLLDQMFDQLFIADGDYLHYRDNSAQNYVRAAARLDPNILVSWHLTQKIHQSIVAPHDLIRWVEAQQAFFSPLPISGQEYADNHVHVGGVYQSGIALLFGLLEEKAYPVKKRRHETEDIFRNLKNLATGMLLEGDLTSCVSLANDRINQIDEDNQEQIQKIIRNALGPQSVIEATSRLSWDWLAEQNEAAISSNPRWIRQQMARSIASKNMGQAWLWFLIWLWAQYQHPKCNRRLRIAIFYLISGLNMVRRDLIMDGQGLSRFVEYYDRPRRDDTRMKNLANINAANTIFQGVNDVAELKVAPSKMNPKDTSSWLLQMAQATGTPAPHGLKPLPAHDVVQYRAMMERWHYCVHFFRSEKFLFSPKNAWKEAHRLDRQLKTQAGWLHADLLSDEHYSELAEHKNFQLVPSRWLRGLDVAGDENLTKTEIFAPALRWLREGLSAKAVQEPSSSGLHLSIHCGEDYAHPLSGMRHIDETVRFCEMRSGDRLGHALAIGISAQQWIEVQGEILLPVEEHVDNLVWAWHYASILSDRLPLANQVLHSLERKIHKFKNYIPWLHTNCMEIDLAEREKNDYFQADLCSSNSSLSSIAPDILLDAWNLRRNCFYQFSEYKNKGKIPTDEVIVGVPDIAQLSRSISEGANDGTPDSVAIYFRRWRWLELHPDGKSGTKGCERISPMKKVRIRLESNCHHELPLGLGKHVHEGLIEDSHSEQELAFMDALQDYMLDIYDAKGLMIEVNPTSNVYIARMTKHADHPIFRWNPPNGKGLQPGEAVNKFGLRRGPIRVCVNTDDPGIMPTTLRTEFSLLLEAAMERGVSRTDAEIWLENLRVQGLDQFNKKHQPVWVRKVKPQKF